MEGYTQYPVIKQNEKNVYTCITESLPCAAEINSVNQLYFDLNSQFCTAQKFFREQHSEHVSYFFVCLFK